MKKVAGWILGMCMALVPSLARAQATGHRVGPSVGPWNKWTLESPSGNSMTILVIFSR